MSDEQRDAREAAGWAKSVSQLTISEVPEGALNLNVEGRRLTSPIQGFGKMWQKTYQVRLPAERVSAAEERHIAGLDTGERSVEAVALRPEVGKALR